MKLVIEPGRAGNLVIEQAGQPKVFYINQGRQGPPGRDAEGVSGARLKRFFTPMEPGRLIYVLPELPTPETEIMVLVNGLGVAHALDGVNLAITEYSAGFVEATDLLEVFYQGN
jgi:hypothetical protein